MRMGVFRGAKFVEEDSPVDEFDWLTHRKARSSICDTGCVLCLWKRM